jgi:hypothetical protein
MMDVAVLRARINGLLADVRKLHGRDLVGVGYVEQALLEASASVDRIRTLTAEERRLDAEFAQMVHATVEQMPESVKQLTPDPRRPY